VCVSVGGVANEITLQAYLLSQPNLQCLPEINRAFPSCCKVSCVCACACACVCVCVCMFLIETMSSLVLHC